MTDMILIILRMFVLITLIIPDFGATKANKTLNNQDKNCITRTQNKQPSNTLKRVKVTILLHLFDLLFITFVLFSQLHQLITFIFTNLESIGRDHERKMRNDNTCRNSEVPSSSSSCIVLLSWSPRPSSISLVLQSSHRR